jgi:hypothetical protein
MLDSYADKPIEIGVCYPEVTTAQSVCPGSPIEEREPSLVPVWQPQGVSPGSEHLALV